MATLTSNHQRFSTADSPLEVMDSREEAAALHERFVEYVHTLSDPNEIRTGVWMEHSYARARGTIPQAVTESRVLLASLTSRVEDELDVERLDPVLPELPDDPCDENLDEQDPAVEDDWEAGIIALAPTPAHVGLAECAIEILRELRLASLAGNSRREAARTAARKLRVAFAPLWATPVSPAGRAPPWLHAAILAHLPRSQRRQYDEVIEEFRRAAPKLAERLGAARAAGQGRPLTGIGPALGPGPGPWLAWVGSDRWTRRLAALVHTRVLPLTAPVSAPDAWCAAAVSAARSALSEVMSAAGDRPVFLGGSSAGAAACVALATGSGGMRLRGLLLLAPMLITAEGSRDNPEDPLHEVRVPMLVVCGGARAVVRAVCARAGRRAVEVRGAGRSLRLPAPRRAKYKLHQRALDAAIAEECARWMSETIETAQEEPVREKHRMKRGIEMDDDEYAHLPTTSSSATLRTTVHSNTRSIEIIDGRVVSRSALTTPTPPPAAAGSTPLAAPVPPLVPRRAAPTAADIMQMPIVFADDDTHSQSTTEVKSSESAVVRVRGGVARRYRRVIVAKRPVANRPLLIRPNTPR